MGIDITITATSRPDILRRTLKSFRDLMIGPHMDAINNVFINIDPVGTHTQRETANVCGEFFPVRKLTIHMPPAPSFPKAFIWTWAQTLNTNSACVFHLEDDWELLRSIDLQQLFILLYLYPDLALLRLSAFPSGTHIMKCWDKMISWNGTFFEVPPNLRGLLGYCGHPSLIRKEFVKTVLPHLDDSRNPEKQIKGGNTVFGKYILEHRFGVYQPPDTMATVRDIGRMWMVENGFRKSGPKAWFTQWETKDGIMPDEVQGQVQVAESASEKPKLSLVRGTTT